MKPPAARLANSAPPIVVRSGEAPTTTIARGLRTASIAATADSRSRWRKRSRASSVKAVGISTVSTPGSEWTCSGSLLSRKTPSILWFSGSTSATKVEIPCARAPKARWASRIVASPLPRIVSETSKATSARSEPAP